jgi:hypothetical protein
MRKFILIDWIALVAFISSALWLLIFPDWSTVVTTPPLSAPIQLSPPGKINKEINVPIKDRYELNFSFRRAGHSFESLKSLIDNRVYKDGKPVPSGTTVPINWEISNASDGIVAHGEVESFGANSWSQSDVGRTISTVTLEPGEYTFSAGIPRDVPEFKGIETRLTISIPAKNSTSWQIGVVWWGGIATYIVFWPALFSSGFILLIRAWTHLSAKRGQ